MNDEGIAVNEKILVPDFSGDKLVLTQEEVEAREKARARLEEMCRIDAGIA